MSDTSARTDSSALASALIDTSSMAWGAVLAVAYCSPLSGRFVSDNRGQAAPLPK